MQKLGINGCRKPAAGLAIRAEQREAARKITDGIENPSPPGEIAPADCEGGYTDDSVNVNEKIKNFVLIFGKHVRLLTE